MSLIWNISIMISPKSCPILIHSIKNLLITLLSSYSSHCNIFFLMRSPIRGHCRFFHKDIEQYNWQPNKMWSLGSHYSLIIKTRGIKPKFPPSEPSSFLDFQDKCGPAVSLTFQDTGTSRFQMPWTSPRKHASLNLPFSNVPVGRKHFFFQISLI